MVSTGLGAAPAPFWGCHELRCPIFLDLSTLGTLLRVNLAERKELLSCSCGVWRGTGTRARVMRGWAV